MKLLVRTVNHLVLMIAVTGLFSFNAAPPDSLEQDILAATNKLRASRGLPGLTMRADLNEMARQHSADMASGKEPFGHGGFEKRYALATKQIKGLTTFGENVAYGVRSANEVVGLWKKSTEHRRNMLGHFKYMGIGIATSSGGVMYYTQVFAD